MVIPRALEDLDQTLPLASCWIEELQPLRLPIELRETEKELVALPELQQELQSLAPTQSGLQLPESRQPKAEGLLEFSMQTPQEELPEAPQLPESKTLSQPPEE